VIYRLLRVLRALLAGARCPDCRSRFIGPYLGIGNSEVWLCRECGRAW
jgi:hypothetical protein